MKLRENRYYWVTTVTAYRGVANKPKYRKVLEPSIGFYEEDGSWSLVGSDEIYKTFTTNKNIGHCETAIKPICEVIGLIKK